MTDKLKSLQDDIEQMLTLEEAAEVLKCSTATIKRYITKGRKTNGEAGIWPVYRLPGKWLIPPSSIKRRMKRHVAV